MRAGSICIATAALFLGAAIAAATSGQAATVDLTGSRFGQDGLGAFSGYGSSTSKNNVIGYGPSNVTDPTNGGGWLLQSSTKAGKAVSNVPFYAVDWFFVGAESGDSINFLQLNFIEHNENNRLGGQTHSSPWFLGTTTGAGVGSPIALSLLDQNTGTGLLNGANHKPDNFVASLMYAYVEPLYKRGVLKGWKLTRKATDWFVFGFDDPGSKDNDHDDFVGIGHVREIAGPPSGPPITTTPLPGALPLMATALGGGFLFSRWRGRFSQRSKKTRGRT